MIIVERGAPLKARIPLSAPQKTTDLLPSFFVEQSESCSVSRIIGGSREERQATRLHTSSCLVSDDALWVSKGIISLWENGLREPKLSNLIVLAEYFKVSIDYLAGLEE